MKSLPRKVEGCGMRYLNPGRDQFDVDGSGGEDVVEAVLELTFRLSEEGTIHAGGNVLYKEST